MKLTDEDRTAAKLKGINVDLALYQKIIEELNSIDCIISFDLDETCSVAYNSMTERTMTLRVKYHSRD